ncbi:hypothetical protein SAMN05421640_2500 [Ekhidna lutea]|uniref:Lipoprotein n=1 Tax=Ekhidna lutea TaxID=447679 RepID=A0A239K823_EKHLU|nr:hypothetical protein [Ekhidna lutea]SNT14527.1 hypothetical protein SAMN05421640_2500 [Ekhidna lutea]
MNRIRIVFFISVLTLISCNKKTTGNSVSNEYADCDWNASKNYALCTSEIESNLKDNNPKGLEYKILDKNNNVIKQGTVDRGSVSWLDDGAIQITRIPGNISEDMDKDDFVEVYKISSDSTISKKAYLESKN